MTLQSSLKNGGMSITNKVKNSSQHDTKLINHEMESIRDIEGRKIIVKKQ